MSSASYESKIEEYKSKEKKIQKELDDFISYLEKNYFSFEYTEAMHLEKYSTLTYKLTFWRSEYSVERVIYFDALFTEMEKKYMPHVCLAKGAKGVVTEQIWKNMKIKEHIDELINRSKQAIEECQTRQKYYRYKLMCEEREVDPDEWMKYTE